MTVRRAAVIGAGVMGSGIAAHLANAGVSVLLLDVVPERAGERGRNAVADQAIDRLKRADPAAFMHRRNARRITPGNVEDHLDGLGECDWIIESVVEDPAAKRDLYARIDRTRRPGSIVSSNTSTIPLALLTKGLEDSFRRDFLITHFFNPPRYMRLLELVSGPKTRAEAVATIRDFADRALGKGVIRCKDTPGFIANRLGAFWTQCAIVEALDGGLGVEAVDAIVGPPMGIPKTGVFGLIDLVGLDLAGQAARLLDAVLPKDDAFHEVYREPELFRRMIADGYVGRKGRGGFYRLKVADGEGIKEVIDLGTGAYARAKRPKPDCVAAAGDDLRALVEHPDEGGRYAWRVLSRTLAYAAGLVPEVADDVVAVDQAMRLGYNWRFGPFELADRLDAGWLADRLAADGESVPPLLRLAAERGGFYRAEGGRAQFLDARHGYGDVVRPPGVLLLGDAKLRREALAANASATLWDIGDGVACFEVHSTMNTLDEDVFQLLAKAIDMVANGHVGLVIHNEGEHFSVGVNLGHALFAANVALWPAIEDMVIAGQRTMRSLKYAPFPVVGAPSGMALGGGCEMLLHCDAVAAHAEAYLGLVEVGVGLIPGWGGCKELLQRMAAAPNRPRGPMPPVAGAFETIAKAKVSRSGEEAKEMLFLRPGDEIVMNRDRVLAAAKARVLTLCEDYRPPEAPRFTLPGESGRAALGLALDDLSRQGTITAHDRVVLTELAHVLTGGDTDVTEELGEDDILALERQAVLRLIRAPATLARMEHMLATGKPLRN